MKTELNGYRYDTDQVVGVCPDHGGPLVDTPASLGETVLTEEQLAEFHAGLWGIAFCPTGRHYHIWTLPPINNRPNAKDSDPFGTGRKIPLDKMTDL